MLVACAEDHARRLRATQMVFWSDTRFTTAHRLYERLGYKRVGGTRELGDISNSVEYLFEKHI
jgi:putative acetyltransferase